MQQDLIRLPIPVTHSAQVLQHQPPWQELRPGKSANKPVMHRTACSIGTFVTATFLMTMQQDRCCSNHLEITLACCLLNQTELELGLLTKFLCRSDPEQTIKSINF